MNSSSNVAVAVITLTETLHTPMVIHCITAVVVAAAVAAGCVSSTNLSVVIYTVCVCKDAFAADDETAAVAAVLPFTLPGETEVGLCVYTEHLQQEQKHQRTQLGIYVHRHY